MLGPFLTCREWTMFGLQKTGKAVPVAEVQTGKKKKNGMQTPFCTGKTL